MRVFWANGLSRICPPSRTSTPETSARTSPSRERKRAFVIISDAFRYEAAKELTETLNGRYRMNAQLSAMLGVLPSYTALGMASLLPHETLATTTRVMLVDGKPVAGTEARGKQLATVRRDGLSGEGPARDEARGGP